VSNAAFYPYGPGTADILDPAADDSSSGAQSLSTPFPFFGNSYSELYVSMLYSNQACMYLQASMPVFLHFAALAAKCSEARVVAVVMLR